MGDGTPIEGLVSSFDSETEKETALLMEEVSLRSIAAQKNKKPSLQILGLGMFD